MDYSTAKQGLIGNEKPPVPNGTSGSVLQSAVLGAFDARLGDVDLELVVTHGVVVEHADGLIGFFLGGHGHKGKALRHASALLRGDIHRSDVSRLGEQGLDFILCRGLVQVSYIYASFHLLLLSTLKGTYPAWPEIK
jgi:hypothetical protein